MVIMRREFFLLGLAGFSALANAQNFVVNGSFESGAVGFTSDYGYEPPNLGLLTPAKKYTVEDNPVDSHPSWAAFGDHTTGLGNMFLANGGADPADKVWSQTVSGLVVGGTYTFTVYGASVYSVSPAVIRLQVDGSTVDTKALGSTPGSWGKIEGTWVASSSSAVLSILDLTTAGDGNDFALDDISFVGPVPEPGTLFALGLGAYGVLGRKIRRKGPQRKG